MSTEQHPEEEKRRVSWSWGKVDAIIEAEKELEEMKKETPDIEMEDGKKPPTNPAVLDFLRN